MKASELFNTLFTVLVTAAAIKAAVGTIITPLRGKHPIPGKTGRGMLPVEMGIDGGIGVDDDDLEYGDLT